MFILSPGKLLHSPLVENTTGQVPILDHTTVPLLAVRTSLLNMRYPRPQRPIFPTQIRTLHNPFSTQTMSPKVDTRRHSGLQARLRVLLQERLSVFLQERLPLCLQERLPVFLQERLPVSLDGRAVAAVHLTPTSPRSDQSLQTLRYSAHHLSHHLRLHQYL